MSLEPAQSGDRDVEEESEEIETMQQSGERNNTMGGRKSREASGGKL